MKRLTALSLLVLLAAGLLSAVPVDPRLKEKLENEGKPVPREPDLPTAQVYWDAALQSHVKRTMGQDVKRVNTTGTQKVLVLMVDFSDKTHSKTKAQFDELLFSDDTYATGSFRDYYQDISHGTFQLEGPVALDWVRITVNNYSYYTYNGYGTDGPYPHNAQGLVKDLVDAVDVSIDFSQYDQDADGFVDHLIVIHAGKGAEATGSTDDIWSHQWSTYEWDDANGNGSVDSGEAYYLERDGVKIYEYCIQPEVDWSNALVGIGVFAHEFGHMLGLPDLYDTDYSSEGTGIYCLMSGGSWGGGGTKPIFMSAWCRYQLGWVNPIEITESNTGTYTIPQVADNADTTVIKIWKEGVYTGNEYFLVENRYKTGWDISLPSSGLAIWHVDESMSGNTNESHYLVALEQADGDFDLENGNSSDTGDLYPGIDSVRSFTDLTTPSTRNYAGQSTDVSIRNISDAGASMTASFFLSGELAAFDFITPDNEDCFTPGADINFSWQAAGEDGTVTYYLERSETASFDSVTTLATTTGLAFTPLSPAVGTYYYRVRANKDGVDKYSTNSLTLYSSTVQTVESFDPVTAGNPTDGYTDLYLVAQSTASGDELMFEWTEPNTTTNFNYYHMIYKTDDTAPAPMGFVPGSAAGKAKVAVANSLSLVTEPGEYYFKMIVENKSDTSDKRTFETTFNVRDFKGVLLPNLLNDSYLRIGVVGEGLTEAEEDSSTLLQVNYNSTDYTFTPNGSGSFSSSNTFNSIAFPAVVSFTVEAVNGLTVYDTGIVLNRTTVAPVSNPYALHSAIALEGEGEFTMIRMDHPEMAGLTPVEGTVYYLGSVDSPVSYTSETHKLARWKDGGWRETRLIDEAGYYAVLSGSLPPLNFEDGSLHNSPNPFNPTTTVTYTVAEPGHVALKVYDSRGRVVKVLKEGMAQYAGEFEVEWDGRDSHGRALPSGVYYAVLEVDGRRFTRKMVILK